MVNQNELYHYGVLGQKWGVRRFQDKAGRLTPLGKAQRFVDQHVQRNEEIEQFRTEIIRDELKKYGINRDNDSSDFTINKGATVNRFETKGAPDHPGMKYVSLTGRDKDLYKSRVDQGDLRSVDRLNYKISNYMTTKKLKGAGSDVVDSVIRGELGDKKLSEIDSLRGNWAVNIWMNKHKDVKAVDILDIDELRNTHDFYKDNKKDMSRSDKKTRKMMDDAADVAYEIRKSLIYNEHDNSPVVKKLQARGYDAMLDMEDYDVAEFPVIVFESAKNLKNVKK